jgi:hypothetical protein
MSAAIWVIIGVVLAWLLNFLYEERKFRRQLIIESHAKYIEKREQRLDEINTFVKKLASQFSEYRKMCFRIIKQDIANTMNALDSLSRASEDFQYERIINIPNIYSMNSPELNRRWDSVSSSYTRVFALKDKIHQAYEKDHLHSENESLEQEIVDIENDFVKSLSQFIYQLDQVGFEEKEDRKSLAAVGEMIGRLKGR